MNELALKMMKCRCVKREEKDICVNANSRGVFNQAIASTFNAILLIPWAKVSSNFPWGEY